VKNCNLRPACALPARPVRAKPSKLECSPSMKTSLDILQRTCVQSERFAPIFKALILGHNHPTGEPAPSIDDLDITRELIQAGEYLKIPARSCLKLDHNTMLLGEGKLGAMFTIIGIVLGTYFFGVRENRKQYASSRQTASLAEQSA